jgi:hypothetical protein
MEHTMSITQDEKELLRYIKRQWPNVKIMVPGSEIIAFRDFIEICMLALDTVGQLVLKPQPNGEVWPALKPGFVPQPQFLGRIAALCEARVRAIRTGATERFVTPDSSDSHQPAISPLSETPVVELNLEASIREVKSFYAAYASEFNEMPIEEFRCLALPAMAINGLAKETIVNGRSVWRPTKKLKRMMRRAKK